jgi:opacity protein-like surface antigen
VLGAVSTAHAADMPILRGSFTDGLSRTSVNWQGVYAGGQGSWGSVRSNVPGSLDADLQASFTSPSSVSYRWPPLNMANQRNAGYGVFFGYNSQWDDVVLGLEGNYTHDNFRARTAATGIQRAPDNVTVLTQTFSTATVSLTDFGSLRLRSGYEIGCFLPYAFVGVGFGQQTIDRTVSASPTPLQGVAAVSDSNNRLVYGYTLGAGVDVSVYGGLFARAEYEYRRITTNIESNINTLRLGLGYKF